VREGTYSPWFEGAYSPWTNYSGGGQKVSTHFAHFLITPIFLLGQLAANKDHVYVITVTRPNLPISILPVVLRQFQFGICASIFCRYFLLIKRMRVMVFRSARFASRVAEPRMTHDETVQIAAANPARARA
jgi:hypothetical protein